MMDGLKMWLLGIVAAAFAGSLAKELAGRRKEMVRLAGGLLLLLALLRPLAGADWESLDLELPQLREDAARQSAAYLENQFAALSFIIEETSESYIWDKACELGIQCTVSVRAEMGEDGVPLPASVTITGPYDTRLAAYLEDELGIPVEKQFWQEEEIWSEKNERELG